MHKCETCKHCGEHQEMGFSPVGVCHMEHNLHRAILAYNAKECPFKEKGEPKLEFNRKIGNIEVRACPPRLVAMYDGEPNDTIDVVMWNEDADGKRWRFSIAYFKRGKEGYSLQFVGARPFMYVAEERVPELWKALHEAQKVLDGWFDDTEAMKE